MSLAARARTWRAEGRRVIVLEASVSGAAGAAIFFGATALIDRAAALPRDARWTAFAAGGAGLVWSLYRRGVGPWRALDWDAVFAAAARRWPQTGPFFSSAWALAHERTSPGVSDELRRAHVERADRMAAGLESGALFSWTPSRVARFSAVAAAAVLAANAFWGDRASWRRVLVPWDDAALERWIEVIPGDARLDWGATAEVKVRPRAGVGARGVRVAELGLDVRGSDGVWRPAPWTRVEAREASWSTGALSSALDYRVRWRDLRGRSYRLEPVPAPRWARVTAVVKGTRGERRFVLGEDSAVRARRGDWVTLEGQVDAPLSAAAWRLSGLPATAMTLQNGVWKGGFPAQEDATLSFDLVSADGRRDPSPPVYGLSVAADAPPTAELLSPQVPLVASPEDAIPVVYAARDDGVVTRVALMARVPGRADQSFALVVPAPAREEVLGDYSWSLRGLPTGVRAEFWIEAWDDASPPQVGRSEKGVVEIVDAAAEHRAALAARVEAEAALERAAGRAEAAQGASEKGDLAAAAAQTRALRAEWPAAARALEEWARRAGGDPRAEEGLAEEAAAAAREFARAGADGLPAAEKAVADSNLARAAAEQRALAEQARGVQRALREGAQAQSARDAADLMERAGRDAEELSQQAEALAARGRAGTVSSAELESLEKSLQEIEKALQELRSAAASASAAPESARGGSLNDALQSASELRRALASGDVASAAQAARRLAERLKSLAREVAEAGRRASDARSQRGRESAERVRRSWREATDAQVAAAEAARRLESERRELFVRAQKEALARGTPPPLASALPPADPVRTAAAAETQGRAIASARRLRGDLREAASQEGYLAGRLGRRVDEAVTEESTGEGALRRGDSAEGLARAEAALSLLQQGGREAESAAAGAAAGGAAPGASTRAGPTGMSGARLGRVRLPSAQEYRPPRELREELERSLRESRPPAHDAEIREYFKRLAR